MNTSANPLRKILYIFTRTPLHIGAGASVGAIDQPIVRERHTGFPIIPGSSLKGAIADLWSQTLISNGNGKKQRVVRKKLSETADEESPCSPAAWLFGSDDAEVPFAGALQFSEGKLLAFPVRSAKGSFAWVTSPLILRRAIRDGALNGFDAKNIPNPADDQAFSSDAVVLEVGQASAAGSPLKAGNKTVVLEEYTFRRADRLPDGLGAAFVKLFATQEAPVDPVWAEVEQRLVILSDGMMSFFARNACEISQHIRIDDETGTVAEGALFNQECVPSETLFYAVVHAFDGRGLARGKSAEAAAKELAGRINGKAIQLGGDASTGLGWCSLHLV